MSRTSSNPWTLVGKTLSAAMFAAAMLSFLLGCGSWLWGENDTPGEVTEMFYTVDDGKTYFADDVNKLSPYAKDGKEAVRCYVFTCDDGKTKFVAYLERLTPDAKKQMEAALEKLKKADANLPPPPGSDIEIIQQEGTEVKKPGEGKWVKRNSPEGDEIIQPQCPGGKNENLNIVLPGD